MAEPPWTIRRVVAWSSDDFRGRGIESARLDAELLVAHALEIDRVRLYMDLDRPLLERELAKVRELVTRRRKREPVAYILGRRELWSRRFEVGPGVLIPRPETEVLIERALELVPPDAPGPVLDLCTGSGCIAITLAAERAMLEVDATDLSPDALGIAARNAKDHAVDARVRLHHGDLFAALPARREHALITCNPPYVAERDRAGLSPDVRDHEPALALFSGDDGLDLIRRLAREAHAWLAPGAAILIEIGAGQASTVGGLLREGGLDEVRAHRDLAGHERVIEADGQWRWVTRAQGVEAEPGVARSKEVRARSRFRFLARVSVSVAVVAAVLLGPGVAGALDVDPWDRVLARHARGGGVDYPALAVDREARADLARFVDSLGAMPESEPLASWLDAYNALVVHAIVSRWPLESVRSDPHFFDEARFRVAGRMRSLDDIEHRVIRARFPDARAHAALVCGARSCPALHPRALRERDLDATLDRLARAWVSSDRHVRVEGDVVHASAIFAWYRADFERDASSVVDWIRRYAPSRAIRAGARVVELPYDWAINTPRD